MQIENYIYYCDEQSFSALPANLKKAAKRGDPMAQFALSECYRTGRGVKHKSRKKAHFWLRKSGQKNFPPALNNLALLEPLDAIGVEILRSAALTYPLAQLNLSRRYHEGKGVESNGVEAVRFHNQALGSFPNLPNGFSRDVWATLPKSLALA